MGGILERKKKFFLKPVSDLRQLFCAVEFGKLVTSLLQGIGKRIFKDLILLKLRQTYIES